MLTKKKQVLSKNDEICFFVNEKISKNVEKVLTQNGEHNILMSY